MTAQEILAEYDAIIAAQPDTPAKRWCLDNPPTAREVYRVFRDIEAHGFAWTRIALAA